MNVSPDFKPVPTRASLALQKKNKSTEFQAIVFEEPKFGSHKNKDNEETATSKPERIIKPKATDKPDPLEFDIKKARHEVINFAINNQRTIKNQKKMELFQLVKLGAKPPKKAYKNYKDLLDEKKRLKTIRAERKQFHQLGKNQAGLASVKCRSKTKLEKQKKVRAPVTAIDQNYGLVKPKFKKKK